MKSIPIQAVPNQQLAATLGQEPVSLAIWTRSTGVFVDIYLNDVLLLGSVLCLSGVRLVRDSYLGFPGDLVFVDTTGAGEDPVFTGFGSQFSLIWLEPSDLAGDV